MANHSKLTFEFLPYGEELNNLQKIFLLENGLSFQKHFLKNTETYHVFVKNEINRLVAATKIHIITTTLDKVCKVPFKLNFLNTISKNIHFKILVISNLTHPNERISCFENTHFNSSADFYLKVIHAFESQFCMCFNSIVINDGIESEIELRTEGFQQFGNDILMQLQIDKNWFTLDHYLQSITKKYAARAEKILSCGQKFTIRVPEGHQDYKLIENSFHKFIIDTPFHPFEFEEDYFLKLSQSNKNFHIKMLYFNDLYLGFYSYFIHEDSIEAHYLAFDYTHNKEHQIYFNQLFLLLEEAIHQQKSILYYGRTSLDAKASLGATPVYNSIWVKSGKIVSWISNIYLKNNYELHNFEWQKRNPFKDTHQNSIKIEPAT